MKKLWLIAVALWKVAVWWFQKDAETKAKRKTLIKEVDRAIDGDDYRALHRLIGRL